MFLFFHNMLAYCAWQAPAVETLIGTTQNKLNLLYISFLSAFGTGA